MNKFKEGDRVILTKWNNEKGTIIKPYRTYIEWRYKIKLDSDSSIIYDGDEDGIKLLETKE